MLLFVLILYEEAIGEGFAGDVFESLNNVSFLVFGVCWFCITDTTVLAITISLLTNSFSFVKLE